MGSVVDCRAAFLAGLCPMARGGTACRVGPPSIAPMKGVVWGIIAGKSIWKAYVFDDFTSFFPQKNLKIVQTSIHRRVPMPQSSLWKKIYGGYIAVGGHMKI